MSGHTHHEAVYEGGYTRLQMNRMGLWLFIISESFIFLALFMYRFLAVGTYRPEGVNLALGLGMTGILLLSSITMHQGEKAIARGNHAGLQRSLLLTMLLGLVFLGVMAYEWSIAFREFGASNPYGSIFFLTTGMHALHLFSGLLILFLVYLAARRQAYRADDHWGVTAGALYWHFVDLVWLSVFTVLYLL